MVYLSTHENELPLRHLFQHFNGLTTGPRAYSEPVGKKLSEREELEVINFIPIESDLPEIDERELSTDQKYLLETCGAIITGCCSNSLARRDPGKQSHSRWLTTADSTHVSLYRLFLGLRLVLKWSLFNMIESRPVCVGEIVILTRSRHISLVIDIQIFPDIGNTCNTLSQKDNSNNCITQTSEKPVL
nr:unnamed protein product [Callosobruchus analis]